MKSSKPSVLNPRLALVVSAAVALLCWAGAAGADECKGVQFHFHNETGSKIKVRGVEIAGNDGTWTEDINNTVIETNQHHTSDKRRLNKLDSGATPSYMTVNYDKWDARNGQWDKDKSMKFTDRGECTDGKVYQFDMKK